MSDCRQSATPDAICASTIEPLILMRVELSSLKREMFDIEQTSAP